MKYLWMTLDNVLTNEQCDELIQIAHTQGFKHAAIGNDEEIGLKQSGYIDEDIRKAELALIPFKQLSWLPFFKFIHRFPQNSRFIYTCFFDESQNT